MKRQNLFLFALTTAFAASTMLTSCQSEIEKVNTDSQIAAGFLDTFDSFCKVAIKKDLTGKQMTTRVGLVDGTPSNSGAGIPSAGSGAPKDTVKVYINFPSQDSRQSSEVECIKTCEDILKLCHSTAAEISLTDSLEADICCPAITVFFGFSPPRWRWGGGRQSLPERAWIQIHS